MTATILSLSLMMTPIEAIEYSHNFMIAEDALDDRQLSQQERDQIWKMIHYHVYEAAARIKEAERLSAEIRYPTAKEIVITALKLIAANFGAPTLRSKAIASALVMLESICEAYWDDIWEIEYNLIEAKQHMQSADRLEEKLWRDE